MTDRPAFQNHFAHVYGSRWPALHLALLREPNKITLTNPFGPGWQDYAMDAASQFPALYLDPQRGDEIADFCASPGGKSLHMIFALNGEARWHCNDLSPARVQRLKAVFHDCIPEQILTQNIRITKGDGARIGQYQPERYDRVLVDVPCSGERHLLASGTKKQEQWSLKGSKRLSIRQHALLCSALDATKPGGRVVYSTCSISPIENDDVIAKLHKSRAGQFEIQRVTTTPASPELADPSETTTYGRIWLPDRAQTGPIYMCVIQKVPIDK